MLLTTTYVPWKVPCQAFAVAYRTVTRPSVRGGSGATGARARVRSGCGLDGAEEGSDEDDGADDGEVAEGEGEVEVGDADGPFWSPL
ncbi:hypothetical protein Arub01_25690 [Actinomadura rubrobrunea]|uniref:Uncharacterized protein n=1 Tax=Actinomadura rubrobrunea TaxID=115335 RepID=A0A9W6UX47_9ACTN|nr:hypothetical protein Arub01_25690 [Actinomadura rubrobrunea]